MGFLIFILVIAFFVCIVLGARYNIKQAEEATKKLESKLNEWGFVTSKVVSNGSGMSLYVDDKNKKWFIQTSEIDVNPYFFNYDELIEFEVYEDGNSIAKGRAGSAVVGGILFGTIGAVAGGARQRAIKNTCTTLQVRIRVKNLTIPEIIVPFIKTETQKDSFVYKTMFNLARNFAATLAYIENGKEIDFADTDESEKDNTNSSAGELEKYFELKEKGIITEEEFNEKKKQLLNL